MVTGHYEDDAIDGAGQDLGAFSAFGKLIPFLRTRVKPLTVSLALLIGVIVTSLAWPMLLQEAIDGPIADQLTQAEGSRQMTDLIWLGLAVFLLQIASVGLQYWQYVKLEIVGQDIMLELKQKLFRHILSLDISFFDQNPVGRLMARVESDTESLRLLFTNTVVLVVGDLLMMVGIYAVLMYYEWRLALVLFGFLPAIAGLVWIFHRITTHRFLEVRRRMADVTASLAEFLQGMSIIQIFHRGDWARKKVWHVNERKFSEDAFVNMAVTIFFNVLFTFEYLKIGVILLLGAIWGLSPGTIVMFIIMVWKEFDPIARTADQLGNFQKGVAGGRRIFGLLSLEPKLNDPVNPVEWPGLKNAIRFEKVWFSYTDDDNWVLKDVSFEIKRGERVALAGVTGGGKTTVISLLLRLYDPQRGRITIDGVDIRTLHRDDLRRHFALVLQDIILFPGDVASNIGLEAEHIDRERIKLAAKTVQVDEVIQKLPKGYDTEVSEKGANFSRGERQLLSFARALAFEPDVLVLDEATSSVDPETERTIQAALKKLTSGRTSLIIAHRLATILDVDQILVIRNGEIIERGTHTELILQDGYYSKLFHLQFKHKLGETANA